ncbi:hypothetical protein H4R24_004445 [Coemansia sp. RSA 988]|nr:hypothetical protein H4R24_004445 [Coemansia sp. RSA 988]
MSPPSELRERVVAERLRVEQRRLEAFTRLPVFEYRGVDAPPRSPQVLSREEYVLGMEPINTEDVRARNSSEILARLVREHASILTTSKSNHTIVSSEKYRDTRKIMLDAMEDSYAPSKVSNLSAAPAALAAVLALLGGSGGMYLYLA